MKYAVAVLCLICASGFWLAAKDYPYSCSDSMTCPDKCDPQGQVVSCFVSGTLQYPTTCNTVTTETSIDCQVLNGEGDVVTSSSPVRCRDCDTGPNVQDDGTGGCDPLSVDWFASCDPFAY